MKLTGQNMDCAARYEATEARQFGNLHERMKYVMELASQQPSIGHALRNALFDLQIEAQFYEPRPSFGRRTRPTGKSHG